MSDYFKFLGTAGARFVTARQLRASGGVFLHLNGKKILLDPGPGALVRMAEALPRLEAAELDAIILTHAHIDHSNDVNILLDAMTGGGLYKRGVLFAPSDALTGDSAVVLSYLKDFPESIITLRENTSYEFGDFTIKTSIKHQHGVETYGISFHLAGKILSFLPDTRFFTDLSESYSGTDILVLHVLRNTPVPRPQIKHLSAQDAKTILAAVRPTKAFLTHFGMDMLDADPASVAARLSSALGLDVFAAYDGLTVEI